MVTAMLLIDEGELSSGLHRETLEDTEAAIHPSSHLHTPKLSLHFVVHTGISTVHSVVLWSALLLDHNVVSWYTLEYIEKFLNNL